MSVFRDRRDAGRRLAEALAPAYGDRDDVVVLGLPRGGVPVAAEVARLLAAPLDVFVVRKLGAPGRPELAVGAIATGGAEVLDPRLLDRLGVGADELAAVRVREQVELERRERAYRGDRPPLPLAGRVVLLVDDGIATGASTRVAALAVREQAPVAVVAAAPVGPPDTAARLGAAVDDVVLATAPSRFSAVGSAYADFSPTSDEEVRAALAAGR